MRFRPQAPFVAVVLCGVMVGVVGCASTKLVSTPLSSPIAVDGDHLDWLDIPLQTLEEDRAALGIAHDDENLYLMLRFFYQRQARRIRTAGVTLWLDGDGGKEKFYGVRYSGSEGMDEGPRGEETMRGSMAGREGGMRQRPQPTVEPGTLTVIANGWPEVLPESNAIGPSAASQHSSGVYCYELRIPLQEIGGKFASRSPSRKRTVSLGVDIGGLSEAEREALRERMGQGGGMGGMGGGRPPGGGMGGGGMRGGGMRGGGMRGGGRRSPMEQETLWLKVVLAPQG